MRIAILSDIHANFEALSAVLADAKERAADAMVCLGDVVGYGADPNACCELLRENALVTLLGNHDAAVIGVMDTDFYYPAAREALFWTRETLDDENTRWLYSLPYSHQVKGAGFYHSAPVLPSGFYYLVRPEDANAHVKMLDRLEPYTFIGHSHLTSRFLLSADGARQINSAPIASHPPPNHCYIVNVGSVGQPRDRDPRACYGLFDSRTGAFQHVRVTYDVEGAARKIRAANLEPKFADRLRSGS
jgi:diadenosine tetraphosphatase ApaH/serine/threonine PP2A family protein phosphatase